MLGSEDDLALASHEYSDRYELSISNDWILTNIYNSFTKLKKWFSH